MESIEAEMMVEAPGELSTIPKIEPIILGGAGADEAAAALDLHEGTGVAAQVAPILEDQSADKLMQQAIGEVTELASPPPATSLPLRSPC